MRFSIFTEFALQRTFSPRHSYKHASGAQVSLSVRMIRNRLLAWTAIPIATAPDVE